MFKQFAPSSGSVIQLFLSTTPLLAVCLYFLYLAFKRPSLDVYNIPENINDDIVIQDIYERTGPQIALMEMVYVLLCTLLLWVTLFIYVRFMIPKRRQLMKSYLDDREALTVLGDVEFKERNARVCRFADYAQVTYVHPRPDLIASRIKERHGMGLSFMVKKQVRTYHLYTRERVSILVLPDRPFSGQPQSDIQVDVSSFTDNRSNLQAVELVAMGWILFCLLAPMYIIHQMAQLDDIFENDHRAWIVYAIGVFVVVPMLAVGINATRYYYHKDWIINQGQVIKGLPGTALPIVNKEQEEEELERRKGSKSSFASAGIMMTNLCSKDSTLNDDDDDDDHLERYDDDTESADHDRYRRMRG